MSSKSGTGTDKVTSFYDWFVQTWGKKDRGGGGGAQLIILEF